MDANVEAIVNALTETSRHLADTANTLVRNAVALGVPPLKGVPPTDLEGIAAKISSGAPPAVRIGGVPTARVLSESAVPVARSAPIAALAVPVFAPTVKL